MKNDELKRLNKFFNYWEQVLNESEREMLLELASELNSMKDDFKAQAKAIIEHIIKLQLYGYESTAIQTIFDIQENLYWYVKRPEKKHLKKLDKVYDLYLPFIEQAQYVSYAKKVFEKRIKKKYFSKPNWNNLDYTRTNNLLKYLAELIINKTQMVDSFRQEFYNEIRKILGV